MKTKMACYPCTWQVLMLSLLTHILLLASSSVSIHNNNDDLSVLLSFKHYITNDPEALSSWDAADNSTNKPSTDFCRWNGITCNDRRHPGRVTAIRLRGSGLGGTISPHIGNLTHLQDLDLSQNNLLGEIPVSLGSCTELRSMNLSVNQLSGSLFPDPLSHLSKLKVFNVRHNNLTGVIPMALSNLTTLTNLSIESNYLQGQIPSWLCNLTSLAAIDLASSGLNGHIPGELGKLSKVVFLMIQSNRLEGPVPPSIFNISSIEHLDLSFNRQLSGSLPHDIGFQLPNLKFLGTSGNRFEGLIPPSFSNASALEYFLLRENQYHGLIPRDIGIHGNLQYFSVGQNQFQASQPRDWDFLTSITNCSKLKLLDLEQNNFVGILPITIANLSKELIGLSLANNQIAGIIPAGLGMFQRLTRLNLENNLFTGALPVDIGQLPRLQDLEMSHNRFQGQIPQSFGNITSLSKLSLSNNFLDHTIPTSLGNLRTLVSIDISCNFLSGRIPQEILSIPSLTKLLNLSNNALSDSIPTEIGHLNNLISIDFSMNKLTGEIPDDVGGCVQLQLLHLQDNLLQGKIPKGLEKLGVLENLDLSSNNLTGPIPEFLENIKTINHLNLSFNNLSGPVPDTGIFCNDTILSLTGNSLLCGGSPFLQFPECASMRSRHKLHLLIIFCILGTLILLLSTTTYCFIKRRAKPNIFYQEKLFLNETYERISYHELRSATHSFSPANLIGSGSFGNVYKGTFIIDENLATVAIKVLNLNLRGASRSFLTECNALRRIRHRNLVKVITVCSGLDHNVDEFKALVLEFICNGNLDEWLHSNTVINSTTTKRLSLMRRLYIALDVAAALEYLHHNIEPPIVHCDIKPSNILLDDDLVAHVTDFGLAKIMYAEVCKKNHGGNESSSLAVKGTIGYVPPEYGSGCGVSTDGDIYSYGVLLLEMLTGKRPTDSFDCGEASLVNYVKMAYPHNLLEILDVNATYSGNTQDVMDFVIHPIFKLALACCHDSARQRIKMDYVVEELNAIKKACATLMSS